jgi:hypothetical protein
MAALISQQIADLERALAFESERIEGYQGYLSLPLDLVSDKAKSEVREALEWSVLRRDLIKFALKAEQSLEEHGYPNRLTQIALKEAIAEFKEALRLLTVAADEFQGPPTVEVTISEEQDA